MSWNLYFGHIGAWFTLLILNVVLRRSVKKSVNLVQVLALCSIFALFSSMAHAWLFGRCG